MLTEELVAKGSLDIVVTGPDGEIKETIHIPNLVVNAGFAFITSRMIGASAAVMSHMALGTDSTNPAGGNTALGAEIARVALTSSTQVTTTVANDSVQFVATFGAGVGTGAITEAGLLNAASAGTLLCRTKFDVVNKAANDTLSITWKIVIS
jgi:hypothetical protein